MRRISHSSTGRCCLAVFLVLTFAAVACRPQPTATLPPTPIALQPTTTRPLADTPATASTPTSRPTQTQPPPSPTPIATATLTKPSPFAPGVVSQATALAGQVDADRLMADVRWLADDARQGRLAGSPAEDEVGAWLAQRFQELGLEPLTAAGLDDYSLPFSVPAVTRYGRAAEGDTATGEDIIAVLPGTTRPDSYVLIGAHYDHLGVSSDGEVYNGADDDATGVAAVLEAARILSAAEARPEETVVFVAFSAEEIGQQGSAALCDRLTQAGLASRTMLLNLEVLGAIQDTGAWVTVWDEGVAATRPLVEAVQLAASSLEMPVRLGGRDPGSDALAMVACGVPAAGLDLAWSEWNHPNLHDPDDDPELIDVQGFRRAAEVAVAAVWLLANAESPLPSAKEPAMLWASYLWLEGPLAFDEEGHLWANMWALPLEVDLATNGETTHALQSALEADNYELVDMAVGLDGTAWAIGSDGVHTLPAGGAATGGLGDWKLLELGDGAPGVPVVVAVGSDGTAWLGGDQGVLRIVGEQRTAFTQADGLAGDNVSAIAAGPDGSAWFATDGGVSHYDGAAWTTYTATDGLISDSATAIAAAPDGSVWIGTEEGASHFDGKVWTSYTSADGLAADPIVGLAVGSDGAVWFSTEGGVSRLSGEVWTTYQLGSSGWDCWAGEVVAGPGGRVCVACDYGPVSCYGPPASPPGAVTAVGKRSPQVRQVELEPVRKAIQPGDVAALRPEGLGEGTFTSLARGPEGDLWFVAESGVFRYADETWQQFPISDFGYPADQEGILTDVTVSPDGAVEAAGPGGLFHYDGERWVAEWSLMDGDNCAYLLQGYLDKIGAGPEGSLWLIRRFSYEAEGLSILHYDGQGWIQYDDNDYNMLFPCGPTAFGVLGSDSVENLAVGPDGTAWIDVDDTLYRLEDQAWSTVDAGALTGGWIGAMAAGPDGDVWMRTQTGFAHYDGQTWTDYVLTGEPEFAPFAISVTAEGTVWLATESSIGRFDGTELTLYSTEEPPWEAGGEVVVGAHAYEREIAAGPDGVVWLLGSDGGVVRFEPSD